MTSGDTLRMYLLISLVLVSPPTDAADINIGAILSSQKQVDLFHSAVSNLTAPSGHQYRSFGRVIGRNPVMAVHDICDNLLPKQVCGNR